MILVNEEKNNIVPINEDLNVVKYDVQNIKNLIYTIRGKQVMLDSDVAMLYQYETKNINIDFSIVNSSAYYNGIIFKGYLSCVPYSVLSGGRYDNLSKSFNKNLCAIGFALYLGELSAYLSDNKSDAEIAVLYNGKNAKLAFATAEKLRKKNKSVLLCKNVPCDYKGKIVYPKEELIW